MTGRPILYSFRRCPYAMRARMAIAASGVQVGLREVVLRDKPAEMLAASPKGTVPVLVLPDGEVIDESLEIMFWSLLQHDPAGLLDADNAQINALVSENDGPFKQHLDRYKYPDRYPNDLLTREDHRNAGLAHFKGLDMWLEAKGGQLCGPRTTLADLATFPFVRQFANTDRDWFDAQDLPYLHRWLAGHLSSDLFRSVMHKHAQWKTGDPEIDFPVAD